MDNKHMLDDILNEKYYSYLINNDFGVRKNNSCLTETDFYPPTDDRVLQSYIIDIDGGDNFADYCEYIFDLLEEEGYYD